ncbi:unnamed protein product [Effrenium voratum]|uniref:WWE domain-containing protein n=1 Tax=Effrenium voratum TaxID=2562239 RepID=A0AA36I253_9DINO|nr:unnamed protein product [Effrenium voratum]
MVSPQPRTKLDLQTNCPSSVLKACAGMDTLQDLAAAAVASWEVEDDTGWRPCDDEVLQSLRVAGAGRKRRVTCNVRGRSCELDLDAKTETDTATGKRRRFALRALLKQKLELPLQPAGQLPVQPRQRLLTRARGRRI